MQTASDLIPFLQQQLKVVRVSPAGPQPWSWEEVTVGLGGDIWRVVFGSGGSNRRVWKLLKAQRLDVPAPLLDWEFTQHQRQ